MTNGAYGVTSGCDEVTNGSYEAANDRDGVTNDAYGVANGCDEMTNGAYGVANGCAIPINIWYNYAMIYRITSRSNQRLKDLIKNKDQYYCFEGEKLVRDILQKKLKVEILVVHENLEKEFPIPEKVAHETWYANDNVLKKISNLKVTPPAVAILKLKEKEIDFHKAKVVIVLDNIQDPANAGTVFRCAAAFGVYAVIFSGSSVKPNNPKFLRAAQDAIFHVRFQQVESLDTLIKKASAAGMNIYLTSALYPGETVSPGNLRSPCLILFGNEGQGLPPDLFLSYPSIKIEQTKKVDSLNVGVSACIIMHELKK